MKKEVWHGQNTAKFIYFSYKDSPYYPLLILGFWLAASFILVVNIALPQAQNWFSIREEALATRQRIAIMNSNLTFMSNLNKTVLENNRQTVVRALPVEKDFENIINAVAESSVLSEVVVDDFNFALGPIASSSADSMKINNGMDVISVNLSLDGGIDNIKKFITEIEQKMPLCEITSVDTGRGGTSINISFYSKTYRSLKIPYDEPINPVSAANGTMLGTLSGWKTGMGNSTEQNSPPSSSIPLF